VTKHGLAKALQPEEAAVETLHAYFLDRLVPVCSELLKAAADADEIRPDTDTLELLFGVGNLRIDADNSSHYAHGAWSNSSLQDCAFISG
jgi:hypothetical protein